MKRLLALFAIAGCTTVQTPVMYSGACPTGDAVCQRNRNAETLHYLGETNAALDLMCDDLTIKAALEGKCDMQQASFVVY